MKNGHLNRRLSARPRISSEFWVTQTTASSDAQIILFFYHFKLIFPVFRVWQIFLAVYAHGPSDSIEKYVKFQSQFNA